MGILATVSGAGGAGDIVPAFKWNAVQGRAFTVEREQGPQGWASFDQEIALPVKFVADLANLQVGQVAFILNRPDFHMIRIADLIAGVATMPGRPTPEHRSGFLVRIYTKSMGMREWRSQARVALTAMDQIYEEYVASAEAKQGLLPVVEITGSLPIKREGKYPGTDMQPILRIAQWVPRPEALEDQPEPVDTPAAVVPALAAPPATVVPMRQVRPAPAGNRAGGAAHVPPPTPTQQQSRAAQQMMTPAASAPSGGGDDEPEFS